MREATQDVTDFHVAMGIPIATRPALVTADRAKLRKELIDEECSRELMKAIDRGDLVGIADGIVDSIYVLIGTALEYGIPLPEAWAEVQRANMAKRGGPVREDGKQLKPHGWAPPDIERVLKRASWEIRLEWYCSTCGAVELVENPGGTFAPVPDDECLSRGR